MSIRALLVLLLISASTLAAETQRPVGKLTAHEGVRLDGVLLPAEGIPSWPVTVGSTVQTGSFPAVLFIGGERHVIAPNSGAVVETGSSGSPVVRLLSPPNASASAASTSTDTVLATTTDSGPAAGGPRVRSLAGQTLPGVQGVAEVSPTVIPDPDPDDLSGDPTPSDCPAFVALLPPALRFCNPTP